MLGIVALAWHFILPWTPDAWVFASIGIRVERSKAETFDHVVGWRGDTEGRSLIESGLIRGYAVTLFVSRPGDLTLLRSRDASAPYRAGAPGARGGPHARAADRAADRAAVQAEWHIEVLWRRRFDVVGSYGYLVDVLVTGGIVKKEEETIETLEARVERLRAEPAAAESGVRSAAKPVSRRGAEDANPDTRVQALEPELRLVEERGRRLEPEALVRAKRHAGADSHAAVLEL